MFGCIRHAPSYRRITTSQSTYKSSVLLERLQSLNEAENGQRSRAAYDWTVPSITRSEQLKPDGRARLSKLWLPAGAASRGLLDRAGFVRQVFEIIDLATLILTSTGVFRRISSSSARAACPTEDRMSD